MPRYKLLIEYDGTPFHGWQRQNGLVSVQEVLEKALKIGLRHETQVFGSGRTDTGVHAFGQVAHFDTSLELDCFRFLASLNALLRPYPVTIRKIERTTDTFHARFDAVERSYLYVIQNTRFPPALRQNHVWWISIPLDIDSMRKAAELLIGKHDFSTFRASECQAKSPIKTLNTITLEQADDLILIRIKAKSFLHHQVRNIVGSLSLVGRGKWRIQDFKAAFEACDRRRGGPTAPAAGLFFESVRYEKNMTS